MTYTVLEIGSQLPVITTLPLFPKWLNVDNFVMDERLAESLADPTKCYCRVFSFILAEPTFCLLFI